MKIKLDKNSKLTRKYKIHVSKLEIQEQIDKEVVNRAPKIKMDGFRAGKVPVDIIKQNYMSTLFRDAIGHFTFIEDIKSNKKRMK